MGKIKQTSIFSKETLTDMLEDRECLEYEHEINVKEVLDVVDDYIFEEDDLYE